MYRAADAISTLPTQLELYQRSGTGYRYDRRLTRCKGIHGGGQQCQHTVVGCMDSVVVVTNTSATTVTDLKVATPLRVSTVVGHL